jgi:hypothetical protein
MYRSLTTKCQEDKNCNIMLECFYNKNVMLGCSELIDLVRWFWIWGALKMKMNSVYWQDKLYELKHK